MVKVTLNDNLVPCEREPWALGRPSYDLTHNLVAAETFVSVAIKYFGLRRGSVRFSGFVQPGEQGLQIKVWDGECVTRVVRFRSRKFKGVLHIVPVEGRAEDCFGQDLIEQVDSVECVCGYS